MFAYCAEEAETDFLEEDVKDTFVCTSLEEFRVRFETLYGGGCR
jgi:hypothetical protein